MEPRNYTVVISALSAEDGGGFLAMVPDLPGCMADGETQAAALQNVRVAIDEWVKEAAELGRLPLGAGSLAEAC